MIVKEKVVKLQTRKIKEKKHVECKNTAKCRT